MIEIVSRRCGRVIGMGVIVADDAKPAAPSIIVGAFVLLRRNQVAGLTRFLAFVLSGIGFVEKVRLSFAGSKQEDAAFVRISHLSVFSYLIEMFWSNSNCHLLLTFLERYILRRPQRNRVGARIKAIQ